MKHIVTAPEEGDHERSISGSPSSVESQFETADDYLDSSRSLVTYLTGLEILLASKVFTEGRDTYKIRIVGVTRRLVDFLALYETLKKPSDQERTELPSGFSFAELNVIFFSFGICSFSVGRSRV